MNQNPGRLCICVTAGALLLAWAGCAGWPEPATSGGSADGTLKIHVTDKPFPFDLIESAVVTLTQVQVRRADEQNLEEPGDAAESEPAEEGEAEGDADSFVIIFDEPAGVPFDLVNLRNGRTDLLAEAELPAGKYTQVRLIVSGGEVTLTDGRVFPLKVPSGEQSGIKLRLTFEVVEDEETSLLLDVDLTRAFMPVPGGKIHGAGDIHRFHFRPSHAMRLMNQARVGEIQGAVTDESDQPIADASVTAYQDDVEITSTSSDEDGGYMLVGLPPGTYRVEFSAPGYADTEILDVSVSAGHTTTDVDAVLAAE